MGCLLALALAFHLLQPAVPTPPVPIQAYGYPVVEFSSLSTSSSKVCSNSSKSKKLNNWKKSGSALLMHSSSCWYAFAIPIAYVVTPVGALAVSEAVCNRRQKSQLTIARQLARDHCDQREGDCCEKMHAKVSDCFLQCY